MIQSFLLSFFCCIKCVLHSVQLCVCFLHEGWSTHTNTQQLLTAYHRVRTKLGVCVSFVFAVQCSCVPVTMCGHRHTGTLYSRHKKAHIRSASDTKRHTCTHHHTHKVGVCVQSSVTQIGCTRVFCVHTHIHHQTHKVVEMGDCVYFFV